MDKERPVDEMNEFFYQSLRNMKKATENSKIKRIKKLMESLENDLCKKIIVCL